VLLLHLITQSKTSNNFRTAANMRKTYCVSRRLFHHKNLTTAAKTFTELVTLYYKRYFTVIPVSSSNTSRVSDWSHLMTLLKT